MRVGKWQLVPLVLDPLKVYAGAPTGGSAEILSHMPRVHQAAEGKGTWVLDRGFDRRELFGPLVKNRVAFVVRQRGDRAVRTADGRDVSVNDVVAEQACPKPRRWPRGGTSVAVGVWLPEVGPGPFRLVVGWRVPNSGRPRVLLVSPAARRAGRNGNGYVRAYHRRWGVEDANRGIQQRFGVEGFLVRSWASIRRLLWPVAWAFWWRNPWGEASFDRLRAARMNPPWRLRKPVTYRFNWIAAVLRELLHPHPKLSTHTGELQAVSPLTQLGLAKYTVPAHRGVNRCGHRTPSTAST